ncbi:MAG: universal stress protein [Acidimicrobiales bacterium]
MPIDDPSAGVRAVVVPVDGTAESTRAVPLASKLAGVLGCELVVVSVISDFRSEAPALVERLDDQLRDLSADVERRIVQSRTVATTLADESTGGLVCIATTAEPFDDEGFRHTITDSLIAAATSPVVVLGPKCPNLAPIDRIVVAVDPDHDQEGLLYWSTRLGYDMNVPVDLVHVADTDAEPRGESDDSKVRVLTTAPGQSVADRLLEEADGALLAMGSHGRTGFRRLIQGSVGAAVIPRSHVPVLILGPNVERHR